MSNVQNFGELTTRQINSSVIYGAFNDGAGVGNKRTLTLTCSKDDNSSQLSLALHHDDDIGGADVNTATFSSETQVKNVMDPTDNQDVATKIYVDTIAGGGASIPIAPIGTIPFYLTNINTVGNHTWTATELNYNLVQRSKAGIDRDDILPSASVWIASLTNPVVGQIRYLTVINTDAGSIYFKNSVDNTFVTKGGGSGVFPAQAVNEVRANPNSITEFLFIIYELGTTPKAEMMIKGRI